MSDAAIDKLCDLIGGIAILWFFLKLIRG